jgi:hypothetical protein
MDEESSSGLEKQLKKYEFEKSNLG